MRFLMCTARLDVRLRRLVKGASSGRALSLLENVAVGY